MTILCQYQHIFLEFLLLFDLFDIREVRINRREGGGVHSIKKKEG